MPFSIIFDKKTFPGCKKLILFGIKLKMFWVKTNFRIILCSLDVDVKVDETTFN